MRFPDGVYVSWFRPRDGDERTPEAVVHVVESMPVIYVNPFDSRVIRHPLRNDFGSIRNRTKLGTGRDEFIQYAHNALQAIWSSDSNRGRISEYFPRTSREAALWLALGESWWQDFDTEIPLNDRRFRAGLRRVDTNTWLASVGARERHLGIPRGVPIVRYLKIGSFEEAMKSLASEAKILIADAEFGFVIHDSSDARDEIKDPEST